MLRDELDKLKGMTVKLHIENLKLEAQNRALFHEGQSQGRTGTFATAGPNGAQMMNVVHETLH